MPDCWSLQTNDLAPFFIFRRKGEIDLKDEEIKKGAGYLEELAGRLRRERIHTLPVQDGLLTVTLDDRPVGA